MAKWPVPLCVAVTMAGFFALRAKALDAAGPLDPIGYKIGLELIVKCHLTNVGEIPIHFEDRRLGRSKLSWREQMRFLAHLRVEGGRRYQGLSRVVVDELRVTSLEEFEQALPRALATELRSIMRDQARLNALPEPDTRAWLQEVLALRQRLLERQRNELYFIQQDAQALSGDLPAGMLAGAVALAVAFFAGATVLFRTGLRRYASASS